MMIFCKEMSDIGKNRISLISRMQKRLGKAFLRREEHYAGSTFNGRRGADQFILNGKEEFCQKLQKEYIEKQMQKVARFMFCFDGVPNQTGNHNYQVKMLRDMQKISGRVQKAGRCENEI